MTLRKTIDIHWKYAKYVTRHRWFVFVECCKLGVPWRGLMHDLSKYRPCEWLPYVEAFYGFYGYSYISEKDFRWEDIFHKKAMAEFDYAWLAHQHKNPHHWQYWLLQNDTDGLCILKMPEVFAKEMVADWRGAGRAINGTDDTAKWYAKNRDKIQLHPETRKYVESLIGGITDAG